MESRLVNSGRGMILEITLPTTGIDRAAAAVEALERHGLTPGSVSVEFVNASTTEDRT